MEDIAKLPHDIDTKFKTESEGMLESVNRAKLAAVVGAGEKARIPKAEPFTLETIRKGKYVKAEEIKGEGIGAGDIPEAPAIVSGYELNIFKGVKTVKAPTGEKIKVAGLAAESKRLFAATTIVEFTKGKGRAVVAHPGRFKDVESYAATLRTQMESAKLRGRKTPKAEAYLKTLKEMGVDVSKKSTAPELPSFRIVEAPSPKMYGVVSPKFVDLVSISPKRKYASPSQFSKSISASIKSMSPVSPSPKSISPISPSISPLSISPYISPPSPKYPSPRYPSPKSPSISPKYPSPSVSVSPYPSPSVTPSFFPPSLILFPGASGIMSGRGVFGRVGVKQTYRYMPSLRAGIFGIKGKAPKKVAGKYFTGMELRPIIVGVTKFKSRSTKRKRR
jgi:hypothetical protein